MKGWCGLVVLNHNVLHFCKTVLIENGKKTHPENKYCYNSRNKLCSNETKGK